MAKAFVTGAAGFFGANLVRELLNQGWKVIAFHLPTEHLTNLANIDIELKYMLRW